MAEKKNNEKFVKSIKQFMLLIGVLSVVGGGSFIANYWQDREAVRRNSVDIRSHEERVRQLENNQAMITEVLKGVNKTLEELNADAKDARKERQELSGDIRAIKEKVQFLKR